VDRPPSSLGPIDPVQCCRGRRDQACAGDGARGSDLSALDPVNGEITGALIDVEQALVIATALGLRIG
jgi:hypothetical protein